ncbi:MAG: 3-hydroxyacyl-CoA dehydrogenase [Lachnospirales bacterium]
MNFKNIVICGGGVLGSQIAYQCAYSGFDVTIWLRSEGSIERAKPKVNGLYDTYKNALNLMNTPEGKQRGNWSNGISTLDNFNYEECVKANEEALGRIKYELNMEKALSDADLVVETVAEEPSQKIDFYKTAAKYMPEKTVLVTNSSTMLPSQFAEYTGRPEKYLTLHFCTSVWIANVAEVMSHSGTDKKYHEAVEQFARDIKMIPIPVLKEQPGYVMNSMLVPFLVSAMQLWATGVSDVKSIDLTWSVCFGGGYGPFQILDSVGLMTPLAIVSSLPGADDPTTANGMIVVKLKEMIDANKLGIQSGEGFYSYK